MQFHPEETEDEAIVSYTCQSYLAFLNETADSVNNTNSSNVSTDEYNVTLDGVDVTIKEAFLSANVAERCAEKADDSNFTENVIVANVTQNVTVMRITPSWLRQNQHYYNIYCIGE